MDRVRDLDRLHYSTAGQAKEYEIEHKAEFLYKLALNAMKDRRLLEKYIKNPEMVLNSLNSPFSKEEIELMETKLKKKEKVRIEVGGTWCKACSI